MFKFYSLGKLAFIVAAVLLLAIGSLRAQYGIQRLPYPVNTKDYDEICPIMSLKEDVLFFTRVRDTGFNKTLIFNGDDLSELVNSEAYDDQLQKIYSLIAGRHVVNPVSSSFNQDIWLSSMNSVEEPVVLHPGYPLNDALPNSICSRYGDGNRYIVINQFEKSGGMQEGFSMVQQNSDGGFSFPVPFQIRGFNKSGSEINLTMSKDLQHIFLAFEEPGDPGKKDIYLSLKILDTLYSEPVKISSINTIYNETTPFISNDKSMLYFASDRPGGWGGLDIYFCERLDKTCMKWSEPKLLGAPLNTEFNESHPYITNDKERIYYTSNKTGNSDIYTALLHRPAKLAHEVKVIFNITHEETGKNGPAEIFWNEAYTGNKNEGYVRSRNGIFEFTFDKNEVMAFRSENRAFKSEEWVIDPQDIIEEGKSVIFVDMVLRKNRNFVKKDEAEFKEEKGVEGSVSIDVEVGKSVVLDNIYFIRSRPEVVPESFSALRKLAASIKSRPSMIIRVEGHTDNVGDKEALLELSESRANYIKSFLIREGVEEGQILTHGFGDEMPLTDNGTEKARRMNRRVEIRVIRE